MGKLIVCAASSLAVLAAGHAVFAADGQRRLSLANDSALQVTSFKTERNDVWSDNLLATPLGPRARRKMDFAVESGDCRAWTRIDFSDGTYVDADIDYCSTSRITVTFRGISWK
jgi:hypothetical protein